MVHRQLVGVHTILNGSLASQNRGMRTEQIAEMINRQRLHIRKDGKPVTSNQVYAVICRYPDMFVKAEGRIMLMI